MHSPIETTESVSHLPLAMPEELWASLSPAQRAVYRRAAALLDIFSFERQVSLSRLLSHGPQAEVLRALQVLGSMSLVEIEEDDDVRDRVGKSAVGVYRAVGERRRSRSRDAND